VERHKKAAETHAQGDRFEYLANQLRVHSVETLAELPPSVLIEVA
jgi:hypothetical protein